MNLTPREKDKLLIAMAAIVARRRLERGVKLNYPEAIAPISDYGGRGCPRDGKASPTLMHEGAGVINRAQVMDGIAEMTEEVQVEATFPDGYVKLVTVHQPISEFMIPGEIFPASGSITLNQGLPTITIKVANSGDRPIQVGSHYHFFETNNALLFDREKTRGLALDHVPAGTVRFEPHRNAK